MQPIKILSNLICPKEKKIDFPLHNARFRVRVCARDLNFSTLKNNSQANGNIQYQPSEDEIQLKNKSPKKFPNRKWSPHSRGCTRIILRWFTLQTNCNYKQRVIKYTCPVHPSKKPQSPYQCIFHYNMNICR